MSEKIFSLPFQWFSKFLQKSPILKTKRFMSELSMKIVKSFQSQFLIYIKHANGSFAITLVHGAILPK